MEITVLSTLVQIDEMFLDDSPATITEQIREYSKGNRRSFDLSIRFPSSFLGRVMRAMDAIPYGETRTYGDLARQLDTAAVAVGQACGRNPLPIIIPCHRIIASDGPGGYQYGELKQRLLGLEETHHGHL